ncbi:MAG: NAD(P)-dependent oxidoreductase, partial [Gammaproteobacteria bacterium]|nr:NAD(P)-dependent oxidoreductase [Gammaproteobacteria bacterium]
MAVLLFGKNGQLGSELERQFQKKHEVISLDRAKADLTNPTQIATRISQYAPRIVINAAAYTAVDKAESEPELAQAINATAPGVMALAAREIGALFVHYSTDYVFDGMANSPYTEDHPTNPQSVYGATKLAGEKAAESAGGQYLILRTSWVYAKYGHN